ncbi:MAG: MarR family transcriptional regulator [Chitinophagaceae bacterium]|jgi:DNA-binding MarR family transcriptional regulator|nr:MarR family transcriptional regulator [Chitinophagaceae bacterium]
MVNINDIWSTYRARGGSESLTDFGVYLIKYEHALKGEPETAQHVPNQKGDFAIPADSLAGILIGRLERFVFLQAKPVMKKAGLDNPDDFGLLAALFFKPGITKGQLLRQALVEPATGTEMLKRMKRAGWVKDIPNPDDGRSSLVYLTEAGYALMAQCFGELRKIDSVIDVLTDEEKKALIGLLGKLEACHCERHGIETMQTWMNGAKDFVTF